MKARITSIQKALPQYKINQSDALRFMQEVNDLTENEKHELEVLYRATGINSRYSAIQDYSKIGGKDFFTDFNNPPNTKARIKKYNQEALKLSVESSTKCLIKRGLKANEIDHLIYVSCTGLDAPGIDIHLIKELGLKNSINRTAINFMGCYAAFTALKLAKSICESSNSKVLVICTELCTLHFQSGKDEDNVLANSLFGDGSAAVLVESEFDGKSLLIQESYCDLLSQGEKEMAWSIGTFGFEMKLSSYVPDVIENGIGTLLQNFSNKYDYYAIHPGGKKILKTIEKCLNITNTENKWAHEVLRQYGNMSSPTVLFVLDKIFEQLKSEDHGKSIISMAFGPGITLESLVFSVENYA